LLASSRCAHCGRGEGAIFQREDGLWVGSVSLGYNAEGKRKRKTVYGATKAEVQLKLREIQNAADRGRLPDGEQKATPGHVLNLWLKSCKARVADTSYASYEDHVNRFISPKLGHLVARKVRPVHVEQFYADLLDDGVSAAMARKVGTTLGVAFRYACKLDLAESNPVREVAKPRHEAPDVKPLEPSQVSLFLHHARKDRLFALYTLALDSGARQGELLALTWADVDLDAGTVCITKSLQELKGRLKVKATKTKGSRRTVAVSGFTADVLRGHLQAMLKEGHYGKDRPIFCDTEGGHLRKSNLQRRSFTPTLKAAGLSDVRFHDLRHSTASLLIDRGEDIKTISSRLGHNQTSTTLNIYSHRMEGAQARAAENLGSILGGTSKPAEGVAGA
jgi:integrase